MLTKEIKKGMRVRLRNGWYGTMFENCRGNTPMVTVEGFCTETGSVYVFDIVRVRTNSGMGTGNPPSEFETWEPVELTDKQKKFQQAVMAMGF